MELNTVKNVCMDIKMTKDELSYVFLLTTSLYLELPCPESPLLYDFKLKVEKLVVV